MLDWSVLDERFTPPPPLPGLAYAQVQALHKEGGLKSSQTACQTPLYGGLYSCPASLGSAKFSGSAAAQTLLLCSLSETLVPVGPFATVEHALPRRRQTGSERQPATGCVMFAGLANFASALQGGDDHQVRRSSRRSGKLCHTPLRVPEQYGS